MKRSSVGATMRAINNALSKRGGGWSCKTVSWDDVSRGTSGGGLSCWGSNITDTYLKAKDGTQLFTVRPDNWDERLGLVSTSEIAVLAGNHVKGGGPLHPVTLKTFLKNIGQFGKYAKLPASTDLSSSLDDKVSIRFQTTFLPVDDTRRAALEFATEAYNYNTWSDSDPRNLLLLCTTQGVAVQQDGAGAKRILHHTVDRRGRTHRHWLEAERSDHGVGGAQHETAEERDDALDRGKATSSVIGTRAMGTRFNVLMTVQIPLTQRPRRKRRRPPVKKKSAAKKKRKRCVKKKKCAKKKSKGLGGRGYSYVRAPSASNGTANAARVSKGSEVAGKWTGLRVKGVKRHPREHITVTVVLYNTVAGGCPSKKDVAAAIDDMEYLYSTCTATGRLADAEFDFMKAPLTFEDGLKIGAKLAAQPVISSGVFPTDRTPAAFPVPGTCKNCLAGRGCRYRGRPGHKSR